MKLNIAYSSDDNYAQHVGVSMLSLFENNRKFDKIKVYIIEQNIKVENKYKLQTIAKEYNRDIEFINFDKYKNTLYLNIGNSISTSAYARLFLADIAKEDKIIYMDCDSIINGNLEELWNIEIDNYYVAGVLDTVSNNTKERVGLTKDENYINSGMIVINLRKWRDEKIQSKFIEFINRHNGKVFHHDQGVINAVLKDKLLVVEPKYNAMTTFFTMTRKQILKYYGMNDYYNDEQLKEAIKDSRFIHYTPTFVKRPWIKGCKHPLKDTYYRYFQMTPWKGTPMWKDNSSKGEKFVSFLYNNLPFNIAHGICKIIF